MDVECFKGFCVISTKQTYIPWKNHQGSKVSKISGQKQTHLGFLVREAKEAKFEGKNRHTLENSSGKRRKQNFRAKTDTPWNFDQGSKGSKISGQKQTHLEF